MVGTDRNENVHLILIQTTDKKKLIVVLDGMDVFFSVKNFEHFLKFVLIAIVVKASPLSLFRTIFLISREL